VTHFEGISPEMREEIEAEQQKRDKVLRILEHVHANTSNPDIIRVCEQFNRGLITSYEAEGKIRELLERD
jgi:hypothetical protein